MTKEANVDVAVDKDEKEGVASTTSIMEKEVKIHKQQEDAKEATHCQGMTNPTSNATIALSLTTMPLSVDQGRLKKKSISSKTKVEKKEHCY